MEDVTRLLVAARDGDRVSLAAFVRATQADVWRLCAHVAGPALADDLVQETYVRLLRTLPRYRVETGGRAWILTIARRAAIDGVRGDARRRRLGFRLRPAEPVTPPDGWVEVASLLDAIDGERRDAFVLTQVLGLSYAEAAEVCGCPLGTIRSRVARARDDLVAAAVRAQTA